MFQTTIIWLHTDQQVMQMVVQSMMFPLLLINHIQPYPKYKNKILWELKKMVDPMITTISIIILMKLGYNLSC